MSTSTPTASPTSPRWKSWFRFTTRHLLISISIIGVLLAIWISYFRKREAILQRRWLLWAIFAGMPLGFVGLEAGWFVTEVGRQPWVIMGVMKTSDSVTPAAGVFGLFIGFSILYTLLTVTVMVLLYRIAIGKSAEASGA